MIQYLDLLRDVYTNGIVKQDRTGVGTRSLFGRQIRFDLSKGFPLLTTKKIPIKLIIYELLWFIRGDTNIGYLNDNNVHIWDEWADDDGELGPIYGKQWRSWPGDSDAPIDQLSRVIEEIRTDPNSRRMIVSAWNVADLPYMALPPCHALFQFNVASNELSCQLYQRSADIFLGVPFNIASYALLTMMIARLTDLGVGEFIHTFGDVHLYLNHMDQAKEQLSRTPNGLPWMSLSGPAGDSRITDFEFDDFLLSGYNPHSVIKAPIAV